MHFCPIVILAAFGVGSVFPQQSLSSRRDGRKLGSGRRARVERLPEYEAHPPRDSARHLERIRSNTGVVSPPYVGVESDAAG